ncbi:MAG: hypothetical protein IJJ23_03670 [Clostridia bacterium]|nr:hypothetical protein [Clostridia bacterium]
MATEAQHRASAKFAAAHIVQVSLKLNDNQDADIIERLAQMMGTEEGKQGYIKRLIREDMRRHRPA